MISSQNQTWHECNPIYMEVGPKLKVEQSQQISNSTNCMFECSQHMYPARCVCVPQVSVQPAPPPHVSCQVCLCATGVSAASAPSTCILPGVFVCHRCQCSQRPLHMYPARCVCVPQVSVQPAPPPHVSCQVCLCATGVSAASAPSTCILPGVFVCHRCQCSQRPLHMYPARCVCVPQVSVQPAPPPHVSCQVCLCATGVSAASAPSTCILPGVFVCHRCQCSQRPLHMYPARCVCVPQVSVQPAPPPHVSCQVCLCATGVSAASAPSTCILPGVCVCHRCQCSQHPLHMYPARCVCVPQVSVQPAPPPHVSCQVCLCATGVSAASAPSTCILPGVFVCHRCQCSQRPLHMYPARCVCVPQVSVQPAPPPHVSCQVCLCATGISAASAPSTCILPGVFVCHRYQCSYFLIRCLGKEIGHQNTM